MSDNERLEKLKSLLEFKRKVHTNPIEIGQDDLAWLIEKASKSIMRQSELSYGVLP